MSKKTYHCFNFIWLSLSLLILMVDQVTKYLAVHKLIMNQPLKVTSFFNLNLTFNTGVAFSFLDDLGNVHQWFFICLTAGICIFLLVWLSRIPSKHYLSLAAIASVLGGASSNLLDRIFRAYVIDFFDFYIKTWHWPVFNVADVAICVGAFLLFIGLINKPD